mmetsp:Transcript_13628/g.25604  ORF Transcript_13628/g.25604 Transcript_13628/m.25604 type:complete len:101 (+) Transcript_13628:3686-3988(+)
MVYFGRQARQNDPPTVDVPCTVQPIIRTNTHVQQHIYLHCITAYHNITTKKGLILLSCFAYFGSHFLLLFASLSSNKTTKTNEQTNIKQFTNQQETFSKS